MVCPTCKASVCRLPGPYAAWHCRICGTLEIGSEEDRETVRPVILARLVNSHAECLRDDRCDCVVYLGLREAFRSMEAGQ